jgi:hypothetical protein
LESRSVISGTQHFLKYLVGGALLNKDKECVLRVVVNGSLYTIKDTTNCGMFEIKFLLVKVRSSSLLLGHCSNG